MGSVQIKLGKWDREIKYAEICANRLLDNRTIEKAVGRAKDEVLAAFVELNRSQARNVSIDDYINQHKEKTVLILGDYGSEGKIRLNAIVDALSSLGYEPLLPEDIPDNPY